ncbi:hypothetical protein [Sporosarcina psychrophila]|uniref:Phage protein n=1 Tax=Sporosarcina psychrophila TaxID=1476 RepID=A0ABV2KCK0_SPOPS
MPKRYRKKPVVIEAVQYNGTVETIVDFAGFDNTDMDPNESRIYIKTLEGNMLVSHGDWVIKGIKGEFYPCKPDIFEATYDAATSNMGDLTVNVNFESLGTDVDKVVSEITNRMHNEMNATSFHR